MSKHHCTQFLAKPYEKSQPFSLVHSDIWGPSHVVNVSRAKRFITFIDDHTRVCWTYLRKSNAKENFTTFHKMIRTQFQANIKILRTDNGREYYSSILGSYLNENGIIHQNSCVDTPQQNEVAERKIVTFLR